MFDELTKLAKGLKGFLLFAAILAGGLIMTLLSPDKLTSFHRSMIIVGVLAILPLCLIYAYKYVTDQNREGHETSPEPPIGPDMGPDTNAEKPTDPDLQAWTKKFFGFTDTPPQKIEIILPGVERARPSLGLVNK